MKRTAGFSLIELMVTLLIVAVLTTIALPIYLHEIRESRRTSARAAILDLAGREERYFSTHNTYTASAGDLGYSGNFPIGVPDANDPHYDLTVTVGADGSSYSASAAPVGDQTADPCGTYTLDQLGQQGNTNGAPLAAADSADCWR